MSNPAYDPPSERKASVKPRPKDGPEQLFRVHASITTDLAYVRALNECDALGRWLGGENIAGDLICGRLRTEPFRYLEARISTESPVEQVVHVVAEAELQCPEKRDALFRGDEPC